MELLIKLDTWEAVRLKSLVDDGLRILELQGRVQRGIDGYTDSDLKNFKRILDGLTPERPKFPGTINSLK